MKYKYQIQDHEYIDIHHYVNYLEHEIENWDALHCITTKTAQDILPIDLRNTLLNFRQNSIPYLKISGFPINDSAIEPTPKSLTETALDFTREEIFLLLISSCLGFPFSFATQQKGRLVQNIFPVQGQEYSQLGAGSKEELTWHTEDCFHRNRPDFILLMCLRNFQKTPTTVSNFPKELLTPEEIQLLFQPNFYFKPDSDHAKHLKNGTTAAEKFAYRTMQAYVENPNPQAILNGSINDPSIQLDPMFTDVVDANHPVNEVYQRLIPIISNNLVGIDLSPGEILIINNHKAVHGRKSFTPNYNGKDRWLKKINVSINTKNAIRFNEKRYIFI